MDQMANWVRFADTKATILTAGLGVVVTMLMNNAKTIAKVISEGRAPSALVVGGLAAATLVVFLWTLFWLIRAIAPWRRVTYVQLNRFAWPSLVRTTIDQLVDHVARTDIGTDAWQQVLDLSALAQRKFDACAKAVYGFAFLIVLGLSCIAAATAFAA